MKTVKPSEHPQLDVIEELWLAGKRATQIVQYLADNDLAPVNVKSLAKYGQRKWNGKVSVVTDDTGLDNLKELLEEYDDAGLRVGKVTVGSRTTYVWEKQEDGSNKQVPKETSGQTIEIIPDLQPKYERATLPSITVNVPKSKNGKADGIGLAISIPDMQIGYSRDSEGNLTTIHDERVLDIQNQIMADLEAEEGIDIVVWQGDNADFAEFSTHRSAPGYFGNTQLTINRIATVAATQRQITPDAELVYLKGNHEDRLDNIVTDKIPSLLGITRADDDEPVLGLSYLCRFDESNVNYIDSYPNGEFWANDGLRFEHGKLVSGTRGATAAKHLAKGVSTVFGHTHRAELVWDRRSDRSGGYDIFAGSAGCSCKIDGQVPSASTGINSRGTQTDKSGTESWQQGMMVIYYEKEGRAAWPTNVLINDGVAIFRGKRYTSTVDGEGNPVD